MSQLFLHISVRVLTFYRPVVFLCSEHVRDQFKPTAEEERWSRTCHQGLGVTVYTNSGNVMWNTPSIFIITESSFAVCIDILLSFLEVCCRFQRESLRQVQQDPRRAGRRWASDDADNRCRGGIRDRVAGGPEGRHGGSDQRDWHPQSSQQIPPPRDK